MRARNPWLPWILVLGVLAAVMVPVAVLSDSAAAGGPAVRRGTATGFGRTAGGSGLHRVVVTSLADRGAGTLREALAGSHRHVVFAVAGTIRLESPVEVRGREAITLDGSTAPRPGMTLAGHGLTIRRSHDVVVRGIRVRNTVGDNIAVTDDSHRIVVDHCSLANAGDGNLDITENTTDVTVSWTLIGDTRPHGAAIRSKGMLIANFNQAPVTRVSLHHNGWVNVTQRHPQASTAGLVDMRYNLVSGWSSYGMRARQGAYGNLVGNVFRSTAKPEAAAILTPDAGTWHVSGNAGPVGVNIDALDRAAAYPAPSVPTQRTATVRRSVIRGAGVMPRDTIDRWLLSRA